MREFCGSPKAWLRAKYPASAQAAATASPAAPARVVLVQSPQIAVAHLLKLLRKQHRLSTARRALWLIAAQVHDLVVISHDNATSLLLRRRSFTYQNFLVGYAPGTQRTLCRWEDAIQ